MGSVIGAPVSEEYAISLISEPSSSRTLDLVRDATKVRTSSGSVTPSSFGLLIQNRHLGFEIRGLDVGHQAPLEARPQPLHKPGISLGGASLEITICFWWSCSSLKVWKNSSWVRSLLPSS